MPGASKVRCARSQVCMFVIQEVSGITQWPIKVIATATIKITTGNNTRHISFDDLSILTLTNNFKKICYRPTCVSIDMAFFL